MMRGQRLVCTRRGGAARPRRFVAALVAVAGLAGTGVTAAPIAASVALAAPAPVPVLDVGTSATLNCEISNRNDSRLAFFEGNPPADGGRAEQACGTFLAVDGQSYGPEHVPGAWRPGAARPLPFTPISQSAVTGQGTNRRPFRLQTVVAAGDTGVVVTQTDTWTSFSEIVATRLDVRNTSGIRRNIVLYRAGDCQVGSDVAFGQVRPGKAACIVATTDGVAHDVGRFVPGSEMVQMAGVGAAGLVGNGNFGGINDLLVPGTPLDGACLGCESGRAGDRAIAISWTLGLRAGGATTVRTTTTMTTGAARRSAVLSVVVDPADPGALVARLGAQPARLRTGQLIRFLREGNVVCTASTDRRGVARCRVPLPPLLGSDSTGEPFATTGTVEVMFDGTLDLAPAATSIRLEGSDALANPTGAVAPACLPVPGQLGLGDQSASFPTAAPSCSSLRYAVMRGQHLVAYMPGNGTTAVSIDFTEQRFAEVGAPGDVSRIVVTRFGQPDVELFSNSDLIGNLPGKFNS